MGIKDDAQIKALKEFVQYWTDKGDEKQDMQNFWRSFVRILARIDDTEKYLQFEKPIIIDGNQKYIDMQTIIFVQSKFNCTF